MRISSSAVCSALVLALGLSATASASADTPTPKNAAQMRLTAAQAVASAKTEMQRQGLNLAHYKFRTPKFRKDRGKWWVTATRQPDVTRSTGLGHQVTTAIPLHEDYLVVVDDLSGTTCGQYEYNVGLCT